MSNRSNLVALVEAAIIAALAMALSYIPDFASWFTPSFGAIPLVLFSLRRGTKYGLLSGLIWGLMHFILGKVYYLSFSQVLIEYIIAFVSMGFAGLTANAFKAALANDDKGKAIFQASLGAILGVSIRYIWHYIAGFIFWGSYAPDGMSAYWYSFTVNGTAGALTLLFVLIALAIIIPTQGKNFLPK